MISISFNVELKALGLLLVGGVSPTVMLSDISFHRTRDPLRGIYRPTIPGSSVKGVLRSSLSRVAHSLNMRVCSDWPQSYDDCDSCYLFGAPGTGGSVRVSDFVVEERTFTLTHVSLDDETGTARGAALYTSEYVMPGTIFRGRIDYVGEEERLPALLVAMAALRTDRVGRRGVADLRISNAEELKGVLGGLGSYLALLNYLGVWGWDEGV
ncbi:MAG: RAMP superfamily CRISPR-associated protein [Nitrososphaerota archaeon]